MININVFSEERAWSSKIQNKKHFFKEICGAFPKKYKFPNKKVSLTLMLSNNKKIKKLNKIFRNKNKPTDVLSFPFEQKLKISKKTYLGDIIISFDYINKSKSLKSNFFKKKLIRIFIHGFLHLLDFNHIKDNDFKKMHIEEECIYKSVISKLY